jgi:hypothetical protein
MSLQNRVTYRMIFLLLSLSFFLSPSFPMEGYGHSRRLLEWHVRPSIHHTKECTKFKLLKFNRVQTK